MLNLPLPFVFSYVVSNKLERLGELLPLGNLNRFCPCFSQPGGTCPALVALLGNLDWVGPQPGRTCPDRGNLGDVIGERGTVQSPTWVDLPRSNRGRSPSPTLLGNTPSLMATLFGKQENSPGQSWETSFTRERLLLQGFHFKSNTM